MSRGVARFGDRVHGICWAHDPPIFVSGYIVKGSDDCSSNTRGSARIFDLVQLDCGHSSTIIDGSASNLVNNQGVARLGDRVASANFEGQIIESSTDVISG